MEKETFETASGKEYETDYFVSNGVDTVVFRVLGMTAEEAAKVFFDEDEISTLKYGDSSYNGFTTVSAMWPEDGAFKFIVKKG